MLPRERPWLVVVDMQEVFADPDSPWGTPGFAEILPRVRALIDAAGDRAVLTRFVAPQTPEEAWRDYYRRWPFALQPPTAPAYRIVDALASGDRPVVSLPTFGKWGPELDRVVRGARDLVLAGVSTDCCVLSTALAAADAGAHVRVAADACRGATSEDHDRALDAMRLYAPLIEVTDTEAAVALLRDRTEPPGHEPRPRHPDSR